MTRSTAAAAAARSVPLAIFGLRALAIMISGLLSPFDATDMTVLRANSWTHNHFYLPPDELGDSQGDGCE